jgi:glycine oxidase
MLPPGGKQALDNPYDQLTALSSRLHPKWASQLREETGIDTGYRRCGSIMVARTEAEVTSLQEMTARFIRQAIEVEELSAERLIELEPALAGGAGENLAAYHVPEEAQIRNPRHLKALLAACVRRGVEVQTNTVVHGFQRSNGQVAAVQTNAGVLRAKQFCLTAGCWSQALLEDLHSPLAVKPVRGQIVLLQSQPGRLKRIICHGSRYLVPRPDGLVLIGSTEDDVGFDCRTTSAGVSSLLRFALELAPGLSDAEVERTWAGLRPATPNRLPVLGKIPDLENAFVATGHFRAGLQLSAATAVVMSQLIRGEPPEIDLAPFSPVKSG